MTETYLIFDICWCQRQKDISASPPKEARAALRVTISALVTLVVVLLAMHIALLVVHLLLLLLVTLLVHLLLPFNASIALLGKLLHC